jgi:hypothetical protein
MRAGVARHFARTSLGRVTSFSKGGSATGTRRPPAILRVVRVEIRPQEIVCGEADTECDGALDDVQTEALAEAAPALSQHQVTQHLSVVVIRQTKSAIWNRT